MVAADSGRAPDDAGTLFVDVRGGVDFGARAGEAGTNRFVGVKASGVARRFAADVFEIVGQQCEVAGTTRGMSAESSVPARPRSRTPVVFI